MELPEGISQEDIQRLIEKNTSIISEQILIEDITKKSINIWAGQLLNGLINVEEIMAKRWSLDE